MFVKFYQYLLFRKKMEENSKNLTLELIWAEIWENISEFSFLNCKIYQFFCKEMNNSWERSRKTQEFVN